MVDDGLCSHCRSEVQAAEGYPTNHTRVDGQRDQVLDLFLVGDAADRGGGTHTQIDDVVGPEFHGRTAGDDLSRVERYRLHTVEWHAHFARDPRVVPSSVGLHVVLRLGHNNAVDEPTRDPDVATLPTIGPQISSDFEP